VRTASKNITEGEYFGGQECFGILGNLSENTALARFAGV